MKGVWKWTLGLSLGLLVGRAPAEAPLVTLERPVAQGCAAAPLAELSRPVAASTPGVADAQVRPVAFSWPGLSSVARTSGTDTPRPMPVGTPTTDSGEVLKMPTPVVTDSGPSLDPGVPPPPSAVGLPPGAFGLPPGPVSSPPPGGPCGGDAVCCDSSCCVEADSGCCPGCCSCPGKGNRFYVSAEYLMWFMKNSPAPPLVTGTFAPGPTPGALGDPGTLILFGGTGIDTWVHSGARFNAGYWFDDDQCIGLDGSVFFLGQRGAHFTAGSGGSAGIYRPFISSDQGNLSVAEEVSGSVPLNLAGIVGVDMESRLWGAELNLRHNLVCLPLYRLDLVEGFRFVGLDESLQIDENLTVLPNPANPGAPQSGSFLLGDRFMTENRFYGAQVGAIQEVQVGNWFLDLKTKVALGDTRQTADITGATSINGGPFHEGGLLAQPSNIGHYVRNRFGLVTDLGVNFGYQITDQLRIYVGYNYLFWSSVARPGDQIDLAVSRSQLPGAAGNITNPGGPAANPAAVKHPVFAFRGTDFWAHGVDFGLEFRY
jgi:hypothetical protein